MKNNILVILIVAIFSIVACSTSEEKTTKSMDGELDTLDTIPAVPITEVPQGGIFKRLWSDPPTLDPHLSGDTTSSGIVVEIFSGLVSFNSDLELIPDIAEKWDRSDDGLVYTFHLRPNVLFHNGKKVTAHDFKWSIERAASPKTASSVADTYLNDIVGAMDYIDGNASEITGLKVVDDHTLEITIDAPKAYFLAKLTYPTAYVLDQESVEQGGRNWWIENPVGTGPFKLKEYLIGERIVLEKNEDYYGEPAQVAAILNNLAGGQAMAMYENDEIDITGVGLFDLDRILNPDEPLNKEMVNAPSRFSISYIGFNTNMPPFDDVNFRKALNHAVNKELIATEVLSDMVKPSYSILPPKFPGYNENLVGLRHDPELAIRLLKDSPYVNYLKQKPDDSPHFDLAQEVLSESSFADSGKTPRIVVSIPGTGGSPGLDLEVIIELWRQVLGVNVEIQGVEWATYLEDLDNHKFQAYAGLGWEADYPDQQDFLDILFHSESSMNHGQYSNTDVDKILELARVEQDVSKRSQLYNEVEEMILDDGVWVPLWFAGENYLLIKPYVSGYVPTPMTVPKLKNVRIGE